MLKALGDMLGEVEGCLLGDVEGEVEGCVLGLLLGLIEGEALGNMLGEVEGCLLGDVEGEVVGCKKNREKDKTFSKSCTSTWCSICKRVTSCLLAPNEFNTLTNLLKRVEGISKVWPVEVVPMS